MENLLEKIREYQEADTKGTLFKSTNVKAEAKEIIDVYRAAAQQKYQPTRKDTDICFRARFIINPNILEKILKALDEEIVD